MMATVPEQGMAVFDVAEVHFLHLMQTRESHGDPTNMDVERRV